MLTEYTVMDVELIPEHERRKFSGQGAVSKRVRKHRREMSLALGACLRMRFKMTGPVLIYIYIYGKCFTVSDDECLQQPDFVNK